MAEPFIGEIKIWANNFAPQGWAYCMGQLLPIMQNQALYAVVTTTYGGDGNTVFGLPNLRGRVPMGCGQGKDLTKRWLGDAGGDPETSLYVSQIPSHTHVVYGNNEKAKHVAPNESFLYSNSQSTDGKVILSYKKQKGEDTLVDMAPEIVSKSGHSFPHENRQPFFVMGFCIALDGLFPSRN